MDTILIPKEHWLNSQLSIARRYGGININGERFIVTDNLDLLNTKYLSLYKFFGRDEFIALVREKRTKKQMNELMTERKKQIKEKHIINKLNLEL